MKDKMDVINKAIDLMEYTIRVTSNRKRYPVKYITIIKRIQNQVMDIYECLFDANRLKAGDFKDDRQSLQSKAINGCDKLSCFIEISMRLNIIGSDTVLHWQKLINDVKYMTISWRNKEK